MNSTVKYGLMGVIAVALIANVYLMMTGAYSGDSSTPKPSSSAASAAASKADRTSTATSPVAEEAYTGPITVVNFAQPMHDFGTIKQDTENAHTFTFTNTGTEPLSIENAKGSCGCTVPKYPKEPIPPGGTGEIDIVYKPGKQKNKQTKTVTITANTEPRTTTLTISANVEEV